MNRRRRPAAEQVVNGVSRGRVQSSDGIAGAGPLAPESAAGAASGVWCAPHAGSAKTQSVATPRRNEPMLRSSNYPNAGRETSTETDRVGSFAATDVRDPGSRTRFTTPWERRERPATGVVTLRFTRS